MLFIFFLSFNIVTSQEEKESNFNFIIYGGIGSGIVKNENEPNYNLNSNSAEILLNYRLGQFYGIASGIGINELSGSGFNSAGNFYNERTLLKIPVLVTMNYDVNDIFRVVMNFGVYGQNILKDEYRFLNNSEKDIYDGWNFGTQLGVGFLFKLFDKYSVGLNYSAQSDFTKIKSNNHQGINDEQKMINLNSIGLIFMFEF